MKIIKRLASAIVVLAGAQALADWPYIHNGDDGTLQCYIEARGTTTRPFVDLDTPHTVSMIVLMVQPKQGRVNLLSLGGYNDDAVDVWRESLTDMAGSTITYQVGANEPVELTLPLTWGTPQSFHEPHDGDELNSDVVAFDITRTTLGEYLLEIDGNPESVAIKHQAVIDRWYQATALRYRLASETTTFTFKHFAEAKALCDRANAEGEGLMGWFSD